jgi:rhodanese-related sulfurtransferase
MAEEQTETRDVELAPARVKELMDSGDAQLIDVREAYEYEAGHIPGARNIELPEVPKHVSEIDREKPVVFICRGGNRSLMVAEAFAGDGYDAHNTEGGVAAWVEAGLPLEPEDGEVAERRVTH